MSKMLSRELGRVRQDYHEGKDIGEPLELCVDLAENLERELHLHRLGDVDRAARQVIEGDNVVEVRFGKFKEGRDGRRI